MLDKIFNTGTIQSVALSISVIITALSSALVWLGCKIDAVGSLTCNVSDLPSWLPPSLTPWVIGTASVVGVIALIVRKVQGTLTTASAPISSSGAVGTVTQKQVDSVSVPSAKDK